MNDELFPAGAEEQSPATMLSPKDIEEIQGLLAQSVEIAESAMDRIKRIAGPKPGKIPQEMLIKINMGAGQLRDCRDTIARMFREYRKVILQQNCDHSHGVLHRGRHACCKICEWEFILGPKGYVPKERVGEQ